MNNFVIPDNFVEEFLDNPSIAKVLDKYRIDKDDPIMSLLVINYYTNKKNYAYLPKPFNDEVKKKEKKIELKKYLPLFIFFAIFITLFVFFENRNKIYDIQIEDKSIFITSKRKNISEFVIKKINNKTIQIKEKE